MKTFYFVNRMAGKCFMECASFNCLEDAKEAFRAIVTPFGQRVELTRQTSKGPYAALGPVKIILTKFE